VIATIGTGHDGQVRFLAARCEMQGGQWARRRARKDVATTRHIRTRGVATATASFMTTVYTHSVQHMKPRGKQPNAEKAPTHTSVASIATALGEVPSLAWVVHVLAVIPACAPVLEGWNGGTLARTRLVAWAIRITDAIPIFVQLLLAASVVIDRRVRRCAWTHVLTVSHTITVTIQDFVPRRRCKEGKDGHHQHERAPDLHGLRLLLGVGSTNRKTTKMN
jgi:hypothetical protein